MPNSATRFLFQKHSIFPLIVIVFAKRVPTYTEENDYTSDMSMGHFEVRAKRKSFLIRGAPPFLENKKTKEQLENISICKERSYKHEINSKQS